MLDALERAIGPLARDGDTRWSTRAQLHLTLQFLGRVEDEEALVAHLRPAVAAVTPFAMRLGGGGAFGSVRRASVLWAGVAEGGDEVTALVAELERAATVAGVPAEERAFHPHVTLARLRRPRDVSALTAVIDASTLGPQWRVDEVVLFRSETRRDGARYHEEARLLFAT